MVKRIVLLLFLALNVILADNDESNKKNKLYPHGPFSESYTKAFKELLQNNDADPMNVTKKLITTRNETLFIAKNRMLSKDVKLNETQKLEGKLKNAKDSIELAKHRLRINKNRSLRNRLSLQKPPANCKKIKCPSIERPVCANLVLKNSTETTESKEIYVIMINKCEMSYVKCHKDLEATIVPMKNCHPKFKKTTLTTAKGKRRPKREAEWSDEESPRRAPKPVKKATTKPSKITVKPQKTTPNSKRKNMTTQQKMQPKNLPRPLNITNLNQVPPSNKTIATSAISLTSNKTTIKPHSTINLKNNKTNLKYDSKTSVPSKQNKTIKKTNLKPDSKVNIKLTTKSNRKPGSKTTIKSNLKLDNNSTKTTNKSILKPVGKAATAKPVKKPTVKPKPAKANEKPQNLKAKPKAKQALREDPDFNSGETLFKKNDNDENKMFKDKMFKHNVFSKNTQKLTDVIQSSIENLPDEVDATQQLLNVAEDTSLNVAQQQLNVANVDGTSLIAAQQQLNVADVDGTSLNAGQQQLNVADVDGTSINTANQPLNDAVEVPQTVTNNPKHRLKDEDSYGNSDYEYVPQSVQIHSLEVVHTNMTDIENNLEYQEYEIPPIVIRPNDNRTNDYQPDDNLESYDDEPTTNAPVPVPTLPVAPAPAAPSYDDDNENFSDVTPDDNIRDEEVHKESQAECPTSCPLRDVMVCAMCNHRIYKTFSSVCHMRKFQCFHTDEHLELISRYPCMMSAPFLSGPPPMEPRGQLSEPGDIDLVTRYIRCREKGRIDKTPRCTFGEKLSNVINNTASQIDANASVERLSNINTQKLTVLQGPVQEDNTDKEKLLGVDYY